MVRASCELVYVSDSQPGYGRRRCGKGFTYFNENGETVRDPQVRKRIAAMVIPPAWQRVWVCGKPNGHLQVTGRDARQRKVYRYHPLYIAMRNELKFTRLAVFGATLPAIRERVDRGLRRPRLDRERVISVAVRLLDAGSLRVGSDVYAQAHQTVGLTTLRQEHVTVKGKAVSLAFTGKSGQARSVRIQDPRLARAARRLSELPGQRLFQYRDASDELARIGSSDVNAYLEDTTGLDITAKDFRTWAGTVIAAALLRTRGPASSDAAADKTLVEVVKLTARELGNTPAVCRKYYIHPAISTGYRTGWLVPTLDSAVEGIRQASQEHMSAIEAAVLAVLLADTGAQAA